ncbi:MAG: hypothetical protein IJT30_11530 [Muribaculaceae bacterium]|nr:hypothetical protein [Muribaculaceae bacterium]
MIGFHESGRTQQLEQALLRSFAPISSRFGLLAGMFCPNPTRAICGTHRDRTIQPSIHH